MTDQLAVRARPRNFDAAFGVSRVTDQLSKHAGMQRPGHVTLSGPSGSGKTTLALIYAHTCVCFRPLASGNPCGTCSACVSFTENRLIDFQKVPCAYQGDKESMEHLVRNSLATGSTFDGRNRVVLFDEAHRLTRPAQDILLDVLEKEDLPVVCIFTLIDEESLTKPLYDRTRPYRLEAPSSQTALGYLAHLTKLECVDSEHEALQLIASYAHGYRDLARWFDQARLADGQGRVTLRSVRDTLLRDRSKGILDYLDTCVGSASQSAPELLASLSLAPTEKLDAIVQVLTHLMVCFAGPHRVARAEHKLSLLLDETRCRDVVSNFADRALELGRTLDGLLDECVEFWSLVPRPVTDVQLEAWSVRFERVCAYAKAAPDIPVHAPANRASQAGLVQLRASSWRQKDNGGLKDRRGKWLTVPQAREFYEAATFMTQAYGLTFNAAIGITHNETAMSGDQQAVELVSDFMRQMRARIFERNASALGPAADLHRIVLHERWAAGAHYSRVVLHLPPALQGDLLRWLDRWEMAHPNVLLERRFDHIGESSGNLKIHWDLTRELWRGIDPAAVFDGMPLLDVLGIPLTDRGAIGEIGARRYSFSGSINEGPQRAAAHERMGHLSAWNDRAWRELFKGWEVKEHKARIEEVHRRKLRRAALERAFPPSDLALENSAYDAALRRELASWPIDPHDRQRPWRGWWVNTDFSRR